MADKKISGLTPATTPLAGTEVLPIVQSSTTKKVAVDDLTVKNFRSNATTGLLQVAGPAAAATRIMTVPDANFTVARTDAANSFTGDQTLSTGNLVFGTAAKGIDFSVNPAAAGMTSELLNDYEEGTWTPADSSAAGLVFTSALGSYTKVGRLVTAAFEFTYPVTADVLTARVSLPITSVTSNGITGMFLTLTNYGSIITGITSSTFTQFYDVNLNSLKNNNLSGKLFRGILVYYT